MNPIDFNRDLFSFNSMTEDLAVKLSPGDAKKISESVKKCLDQRFSPTEGDLKAVRLMSGVSKDVFEKIPEDTLAAFSAEALLQIPKETLKTIPLALQTKILEGLKRQFPQNKNLKVDTSSSEYKNYQELTQSWNFLKGEPLTSEDLSKLTKSEIDQIASSVKALGKIASEGASMILGKVSKEIMPFIPVELLKDFSIQALLLVPEEALKSLSKENKQILIHAMYHKVPFNEKHQRDLNSVEWTEYKKLLDILSESS